MTNNFLIPAGYLRDTPFDERISGYGHEDTLFGFMQSAKGRKFLHIDNPVLHGVLETNRAFVDKTGNAVRNLVRISGLPGIDKGFGDSVTLMQRARKLERGGSAGIIRFMSRVWVPVCGWMLGRGLGGLKMLDAYKLGLFLILSRKAELQASSP